LFNHIALESSHHVTTIHPYVSSIRVTRCRSCRLFAQTVVFANNNCAGSADRNANSCSRNGHTKAGHPNDLAADTNRSAGNPNIATAYACANHHYD
jgi:hypothetical protein